MWRFRREKAEYFKTFDATIRKMAMEPAFMQNPGNNTVKTLAFVWKLLQTLLQK